MSVKYTDDQKKVIDVRGKNILVSAAAGSGKTAVLTERIIQKICDPSDPVSLDRILIVTFTEAAAAEMKQRIRDALEQKLKDENSDSPLFRQKELLPLSFITTIDSFCLYLLHSHFDEIGLDPSFRVGDEGEGNLMKKDCLKALLEEESGKAEEAFFACVDCFDESGNFNNLSNAILNIHNFAESMPFPEDWLDEQMSEVHRDTQDLEKEAYVEYLFQYENEIITELVEMLRNMLKACGEPGGPRQYEEVLKDDLQFCESLLASGFEDRTSLFEAHSHAACKGRFKKEWGEEDVDLRTHIKDLRDDFVKKNLDKIKTNHATSTDEKKESMNRAGDMLYELLYLTKSFTILFKEAKQEARMVDFSDMEHFALQILLRKTEKGIYEKTPIAKSYEDFFEEVMVDEYQDSNAVQEMILDSISKQGKNDGNRFMVGDVKQSIYAFRQAHPEIFLVKYESFPKAGKGKNIPKKGKDLRIDLSDNFRSRKSVIDSVNTVFERLMSQKVGGIDYDKSARLNQGFPYEDEKNKAYKTELLCLDRNDIKDMEESKLEAEALMVARRIKELYGNLTVYDKEEKVYRKAAYRDMAILLKTAKGVDNVFKEVLEKEGVPVFVISKSGYFEAQEVKQVLNFLSVLDNPRQDILLAGAMTSYLGGFHEEELAEIRLKAPKGELLYDSMERFVKEKDGEALADKISAFLEEIEQYRNRAEYLTVAELLREIMEEKDYLNYVSALPGGETRRGNLTLFLKRAESYEVTGYYGIADFVRYIRAIKKEDVDYGESNLLDEGADVVRILSIHKSKGLEFPICFLADAGRQFIRSESSDVMVMDSDLGIGGVSYDLTNRRKTDTIKYSAINIKKKMDARGEDLRVLYVALTRAREKLIITGSVMNPEKFGKISRPFYMTELLQAQSFLSMLLPIALSKPRDFQVELKNAKEYGADGDREVMDKKSLWDSLVSVAPKELFKEYVYPHESLDGLFVKTTVSELKKAAIEENTGEKPQFETDTYKPIIPQFIKKDEAGGSARGSAYHRVMQLMDFSLAGKPEEEVRSGLLTLKEKLIANLMISAEEYDLVDEQKVIGFLNTSLAKRMADAKEKGRLYLEQPFVLSLPANRLDEKFPEEEKVLIQGVIDVYFEEEDGLVLMDYKTDRVDSETELIDRYRKQLELYEEALNRLEKKKVKEDLIYSFSLGKVIAISK